MKKYILSPLCSALVIPGLGQIINHNLRKGVIILSIVFLLFLGGTVKLAFIIHALASHPKVTSSGSGDIMEKLQELQQRHPVLVDVRGKGFLIGLEYPTPEIGWAVSKGLFKRGVMTGGTLNNAKVNRIEPPGVISYETIDEIVAKLDETLTEVAREFSLNSG